LLLISFADTFETSADFLVTTIKPPQTFQRQQYYSAVMSSDVFSDFPGFQGWVTDTYDGKDFAFEATYRVPWGSEENLRTNEEWAQYWIPVYDQGQTGSCTANAVAAAYSFEYSRYKNITADTAKLFSPSRAFIYYNARKGNPKTDEGDELTPDRGSKPRLALRSLQKFGVCKDESWPLRVETVKWYPGPYPFFEAQKYKLRSYQYKRLDVKRGDAERQTILTNKDTATMDKDGDMVLNNLRSCIAQGNPVVFGFRMFWNDETPRTLGWIPRDDPDVAKWQLPEVPADRKHLGPEFNQKGTVGRSDGHAVLAIGFHDGNKKKKSGYVLCQNSWGPSSTDDETWDYFWMPYSYITDFTATMDFWMMDFSEFPSKL
jgi:hypothetical protein